MRRLGGPKSPSGKLGGDPLCQSATCERLSWGPEGHHQTAGCVVAYTLKFDVVRKDHGVAYTATAVKVMIASPGDVAQARRIVRDVIDEWNAINAEDRKIVLMPVGWETHASPEMGDRPQAIINGQILKDSDLLVAVFWTRLGSPTGTAPSGSVEEIEEHLAAGKPAMIYFSSEPVRPDSVDAGQYSALKAFKESLRPKGLTEEYEDLSGFRTTFSRHLAQTVIRRFTASAAAVADIIPLPKPRPVPPLTDPARELLVEASQDKNGVIMRLVFGDN